MSDPNKLLKEINELIVDLDIQGETGMDDPDVAWDLSDKVKELFKFCEKGEFPEAWLRMDQR